MASAMVVNDLMLCLSEGTPFWRTNKRMNSVFGVVFGGICEHEARHHIFIWLGLEVMFADRFDEQGAFCSRGFLQFLCHKGQMTIMQFEEVSILLKPRRFICVVYATKFN